MFFEKSLFCKDFQTKKGIRTLAMSFNSSIVFGLAIKEFGYKLHLGCFAITFYY